MFLTALVAAAQLTIVAPRTEGASATSQSAVTLAVTSDPSGASVFLDGESRGVTPIAIQGVTAGDHTVRLVKEGFLENSRVISIPASDASLHVELTPAAVPSRATAPSPPSSEPPTPSPEPRSEIAPGAPEMHESGGGRRKKLLLGVGGALLAGGGLGLYLATRNETPTVLGVTAQPSPALQGATAISFSASASDRDGDALTYAWSFGDGATSSGANPSHVYQSPGEYSVTVEVADGKETATGSTRVTVKGMAGSWTGRLAGRSPITFNLSQSGSTVVGSYQAVYPGSVSVAGTVTGSVVAPAGVTLTVQVRHYWPLHYEAQLDVGMDSMSGTVTENDVPYSFTLARQ
jgi:hypothetical protein